MANIDLSGMGVALITPFHEDKSIDFKALEQLTDNIVTNGADYLVVLGTTAETPTLSHSEKEDVKKAVKNVVGARVPLVVGIGGNATEELAREIETTNLDGFSAILSVVPFYNKPSQKGIEAHYKILAARSPLPLIMYNVPGRTGVNMLPDTTLRLAHEVDNIIAVKEASGNIKQIEDIIRNIPNGFSVISGDDGITFPLMAMGAVGVISVAGNAFPASFGKMVHLCQQERYKEAVQMHHSFDKLYELLFRDGNPAGVKCALALQGKIKNELRLPLLPAGESTTKELSMLVKAFVND